MILAIDPGPTHTAFLGWNGAVWNKGFEPNAEVLEWLRMDLVDYHVLAVEDIASYGMPVGKEVFATCRFIGRIEEICKDKDVRLVYRKDIKIHLCGSMRAKDANIRQALIDRIGPQGNKACPGPTYGLAKHDWAALAIAVYVADTLKPNGVHNAK